MKGLNRLLAIPGMFLLVIVLLITSFQLVIYGDPSYGFYEKEYEKYHVTASLHMSMEDVMEVTEHMMDYLIGKEEKLSIVTDVDGREQDFFNEQDRLQKLDTLDFTVIRILLNRLNIIVSFRQIVMKEKCLW